MEIFHLQEEMVENYTASLPPQQGEKVPGHRTQDKVTKSFLRKWIVNPGTKTSWYERKNRILFQSHTFQLRCNSNNIEPRY